jgi:hypothetical protein
VLQPVDAGHHPVDDRQLRHLDLHRGPRGGAVCDLDDVEPEAGEQGHQLPPDQGIIIRHQDRQGHSRSSPIVGRHHPPQQGPGRPDRRLRS